MAVADFDGFDKYGPGFAALTGGLQPQPPYVAYFAGLMANQYTLVNQGSSSLMYIGPALAGTGNSMVFAPTSTAALQGINKALAGNYTKAIGGLHFNVVALGTMVGTNNTCIQFLDGTTQQAAIVFNESGGITLLNNAGTVVTTVAGQWTVGSTHFLEWNITMSASAAWTLYLDGVSIATGTGANFHGSANNFYNAIRLGSHGNGISTTGRTWAADNLYWDDGTGAPLLANTIIETKFPSADSSVQFAFGAYALGFWNINSNTITASGANTMFLRKVVGPTGGATLNSVTGIPAATSVTAKFKAVLYADSAGVPGALTATGAETIGTTASTPITSAFGAGQTLVAGTSYWIGFLTDTSVTWGRSDDLTTGWNVARTYASGPLNPAGAGTTTAGSWALWGNCTGVTGNYQEVAEQAPVGVWGDFSYVFDSTVGHEDLYTFPALSSTPTTIYGVKVSGYIRDATAGARTVTLNTKSSATDGVGSNAGFTPATTYGWFGSVFLLDPNGSIAWGNTALTAATSGFKITA